jgi:hypothetical protein
MIRLVDGAQIVAGVGGQIDFFVSNDPTSNAEWSALTALYAEFRVLGMRLTFFPRAHNWVSQTTYAAQSLSPVTMYPIRYAAGLPLGTSFVKASELDGSKVFLADTITAVEIRTASSNEAQFINVTASGPTYGIGISGLSGLPATQGIGTYHVELLVQLRGRG